MNPMAAARLLLHDTKQVLHGISSLWRFTRQPDNIGSSLSVFTAKSYVVHSHQYSIYEVRITNNTKHDLLQRLFIDIYDKKNPIHPQGHYAYFEKRVLLPPREQVRVTMHYDWEKAMNFVVNEVSVPADSFWRGECTSPGKYIVRTMLYDGSNNLVEDLFLIQDLHR